MTEPTEPTEPTEAAEAAEPTAARVLADRAVDVITADDPCLAIMLGLPPVTPGLTDFGPAAQALRHERQRALLAEAQEVTVTSDADRVTRNVMMAQLGTWLEAADAGDHLRDLNVMFSPPQVLRTCLELLPPDDPDRLAECLASLPDSLAGWRESLLLGAQTGLTAARRQAVSAAQQLRTYAESWLDAYAASRGVAEPVAPHLALAKRAYADTAVWLADVYAPLAHSDDAVGEDRYRRAARSFCGTELDLDQVFAWGWEEIARLTGELRAGADGLVPGLPLTELRAHLDDDPAYVIEGADALTAFLTDLTDKATDRVDGTYFDIDPRVRRCEVRIAGEGAAAAPYYIPPSEDLTRPGSTWFPTRGETTFHHWWLDSVWYHEAVPGHHLQLGAFAAQDGMSRFQRLLGTTSGHAEGWALYAERLSDELGWFDDPGVRIGFLSAQLLRAVRVAVDIGMHTGRRVPAGFPDERGRVTPELAQHMLVETALVAPDFAASEVDRYLGMPGQAISYKVGERVWLDARDEARQRLGDRFDLKDWHMAAIRLGPMGLAQFSEEMSDYRR